jgi:hypothetical protein
MIARRTWWVLGLFPLVFFAVNRAWMYSTVASVDAWKCAGYFVHPELLYLQFPWAYQGSRVLHNGVGWLAYRWLPLEEAILAQKAATFYAGYLFLFGTLYRLFGNARAALAGAMLGLTNGLVIFDLGSNYVFGTCLVLLLGSLWAVVRMRDAARLWAWQMLAGAFFVGAVCTYLAQAAVAPLVFALFVYCLPRWTWGELAKGLGWAALGGAGAMVLQGVISMGFGGKFLFILSQLGAAENNAGRLSFVPIERWWREAVWLPFLIMVLILAFLGMWKGGKFAWRDSAARPAGQWSSLAGPLAWVSLLYVAGFMLFCAFDAGGIWILLQNRWQTSLLMAFPMLVLGGWMAWMFERTSERGQWMAVVAVGGGILLVYGWPGYASHEQWPMVWVFGVGAWVILAGMLGVGSRAPAVFAAAFGFSVAGLNVFLSDWSQASVRLLKPHLAENLGWYAAVQAIDQWDEQGQLWLWFNPDRPHGAAQRWLADFYLYGGSLIGEKFPGLVSEVNDATKDFAVRKSVVRPGMRVLLFDTKPEEIALARAALAERGMGLNPLAQQKTKASGAFPALRLELWEVAPLGSPLGRALNVAGATSAAGVRREADGPAGPAYFYRAGLSEPAWVLPWPAAALVKNGAAAGLLHARIGANEQRLLLIVADENHAPLAGTLVTPGTAVRDAWVELPPGKPYRYLEVWPADPDVGGSFVMESAEY